MRVLVTGGAGYIGCVLCELLLDRGHEVVLLDRFFFGHEPVAALAGRPGLTLVRGDIRWADPALLRGADAICDLAALSNDPAGELDPRATLAINAAGRARICRLGREAGARRYLLASSCSVYGFQEGLLDERAPVNPLTTYARANVDAERAVLALGGPGYAVTVLRQATVYGLAPRMRFDLAINGMTLGLHRDGRVPVLRDGSQWRPMLHVRDAAAAFLAVLEAPPERVAGEIFNVGGDAQNVQILPLARSLAAALGVPFVESWYGEPDRRSYRVAFGKIRDAIGYEPAHTPEEAAREIRDALAAGRVTDGPTTRTVAWYRALLDWQARLEEVRLDGVIL